MKKKTTIKEVAEKVGMSVTTVSLVLNDKADNIPESTRAKIKQAAAELNYQPNYSARSLLTGKTNTIGIIIPDISNSFFSEIVRRTQIELNKYGYDIILCNSEEQMENDIRYINWLGGKKVDGLILTLSAQSMEEANRGKVGSLLESLDIPYIFLDRYIPGDAPKVFVDNEASGRKVAQMLYEAGHRKIGVITGQMCLNSSENRLSGVKKQLEEHGVSLDDGNIYYGKYNVRTGRDGAAALIKNGVTAIFAFNDLQAYGVISYLKENGVRVPEDVSVVGFDDDEFSVIVEPKLTTVKQPIHEISLSICKTMLAVLNGESYDIQTKLATELVLRDSVKVIA